MAEIKVDVTEAPEGWLCSVTVTEGDSETHHSVTLHEKNYEDLLAGKSATPEEFVRKAFEFLLEKEPKESILREFDIMQIQEYFPDFSTEIVKRL